MLHLSELKYIHFIALLSTTVPSVPNSWEFI